MKLRSLICFCALAVASAAVAEDIVGNTCGLMNVPSTAATTMIAVPWVTVGGTADAMKVANLVKTDTLTAGDELYYYDGANYNRWVLNSSKAWEPSAVSNDAGTFVSPDANFAVARGKGLFLVRQNTASEIWLYGQNSTASVSVAVAAGTASNPAYNMIANPNTADYDLNNEKVSGGTGDQIILGDGKTIYSWNGSAWTRSVTTKKVIGGVEREMQTQSTEGVVVPAGQGAWYVSKAGSPTIVW